MEPEPEPEAEQHQQQQQQQQQPRAGKPNKKKAGAFVPYAEASQMVLKKGAVGEEPELQFDVAGVVVKVVQDPTLTRQETGSYLWEEASESLIDWVIKEYGGSVQGRRFVDLGCGCGSVGNALALLGGHVTLTDVEEVMTNVQVNIDANADAAAAAGGAAACVALDWTNPQRDAILQEAATSSGGFDMVVGSELMYAAALVRTTQFPWTRNGRGISLTDCVLRQLDDSHAPLIATIQAAMAASARASPPVKCVGILAGEYHFGYEDLFFEEAKAAGLNVEILHQDTGTLKVCLSFIVHSTSTNDLARLPSSLVVCRTIA